MITMIQVMTWGMHSYYLYCCANHLNETIKHASLFSFQRLPVYKTFVNCKGSNRFALTKPDVFHDTVNKSINILLQQNFKVSHLKAS